MSTKYELCLAPVNKYTSLNITFNWASWYFRKSRFQQKVFEQWSTILSRSLFNAKFTKDTGSFLVTPREKEIPKLHVI